MKDSTKVWLTTIMSLVLNIGLLVWIIPTFVLDPVRDQGAPLWVNTLLFFAFIVFCIVTAQRITRKGMSRWKELAAPRKSTSS